MSSHYLPSSPCAATTRAGAPCRAPARAGRQWCLAHDADAAELMKAARAKGGANRRRRREASGATEVRPDPVQLRAIDDCQRQLEQAAADIDAADFSAVKVRLRVLVASEAARLIESSDLEKRLEEVEAQLLDRRGRLRRIA